MDGKTDIAITDLTNSFRSTILGGFFGAIGRLQYLESWINVLLWGNIKDWLIFLTLTIDNNLRLRIFCISIPSSINSFSKLDSINTFRYTCCATLITAVGLASIRRLLGHCRTDFSRRCRCGRLPTENLNTLRRRIVVWNQITYYVKTFVNDLLKPS